MWLCSSTGLSFSAPRRGSPDEHHRHSDVEDSADGKRREDPDRHVALGIPRLLRREQEILSCLSAQERREFTNALSKIEKSLGLVQTSKEAGKTGAY